LEIDFWLVPAAIVILLAASAFFSSLESAYFSLSRAALERMKVASDPRARRAAGLMANSKRLLATILTGNTLANTAIAALAALFTLRMSSRWGMDPEIAVAIEIILITGIILVFGELTPKLWALKNAERWAVRSAGVALLSLWILTPIALPLARLTDLFSRLLGVERRKMLQVSDKEIRALVQVGHEHGELELEERRLIHSIVDFGDTTAREVMVPRIDMVAVEKGTQMAEVVNLVVSNGHSRLPVYDGNIDNVIGHIHSKDLLEASQHPDGFDLAKLMRPAFFVPEEKKIDDLLKEFQSSRIHMAIVVDEYGGTSGLVTLEDVIEEIFGEIQDEYDSEQPLLRRVDDQSVIANALVDVGGLNAELGEDLIPEEDAYDTLGGFVYSQLGVVPHRGQEFEYRGYRFIVEEIHGKRITRVRVTKEKGALEGA